MKHIKWSRHLLAGLVAEVVLLSVFVLLFGNPISRGIIYTPQAGQSEKLLAVWFGIQPLPAVTPFWDQLFTFNARKVSVLALFFLWALGLVWGYASIGGSLPGQGWRKGLAFGALLWVMAMPLLEIFFPFSMFGEPFKLMLFQLALEIGIALAVGVSISAIYEPVR